MDDDDVSGNPFPVGFGTPIGLVSAVDLVDTTTAVGADDEGATTAVTLNVLALDSGLETTVGTTIELFEEADGTVTGRTGGAAGTVGSAEPMEPDPQNKLRSRLVSPRDSPVTIARLKSSTHSQTSPCMS